MGKLIKMVLGAGKAATGWKTYLASVVLVGLAVMKYRADGDLEAALALAASALGLAGLGHKIDRKENSGAETTADVAGTEEANTDS